MAMTAVNPDEDDYKPGYFGLDDSDMDEWLETSTEGSVRALALAQPPKLSKVLTATVWRGPREGPSGDACRPVPPNRCFEFWPALSLKPVSSPARLNSYGHACLTSPVIQL